MRLIIGLRVSQAPEQLLPSPMDRDADGGRQSSQQPNGPPTTYFESQLRYDTTEPARRLLEIAQASSELDPTSCLVTLRPFETGTVQISHLVDKAVSGTQVSNFLSNKRGRCFDWTYTIS